MPMDHHARVSNMGQQEVPRAKARFKPTSPSKSVLSRGANRGQLIFFIKDDDRNLSYYL